jgi:hypothetical protein
MSVISSGSSGDPVMISYDTIQIANRTLVSGVSPFVFVEGKTVWSDLITAQEKRRTPESPVVAMAGKSPST